MHLHLNAAVVCSDSVSFMCVKERLCVCVCVCVCVRVHRPIDVCVWLMEASVSPSCVSGNH